jgi:hypothetical protein
MITEPMLPIERKGVDLIQVRNLLHVVMLAEPGWVIPAGHFERRYAALEVSSARRRDQSHFKPLHQQIEEGGAEAMFHDLRQMDLGDWHPRDLPDRLLNGAALQKQQGHTLPPLEQWYLGLLHNGSLPGALPNRPNTAPTRRLVDDARDKFPRLRYDLSEAALRTFLVDSLERIGISCAKYKNSAFNGWSFPTLAECREAWEAKYGLVTWDNPADEWGGVGALLETQISPTGSEPSPPQTSAVESALHCSARSAAPKPSTVAKDRGLAAHNYPAWRRI